MYDRDILGKVLGLFSVDELKDLCKQQGLKGFSKYKKAELVNFISTQTSEEQVPEFMDGAGKAKVVETIGNAAALLGGASVAGERIERIDFDGDRITGNYKGLQWQTEFSARVATIVAPGFEFSCDCKVSEAGGMCLHFWAAILDLIRQGKLDSAALGAFEAIAGPTVNASTKNIAIREDHAPVSEEDTSGKTLADLIQDKTQGNRYTTALVELGKQAPPPVEKKPARSKKAKKASTGAETSDAEPAAAARSTKKAEPHNVELVFSEKQANPSAKFVVGWLKHEEGETRESSLRVLIDEGQRLLAHEGCQDYTIRMARQKLLCKHVIQVLVSIDETIARRLLANLDGFRFTSELPTSMVTKKEVAKEVLETKPSVTMADMESLKSAILDYLLAHEGDEDARSIDSIQASLGSDVNDILPVLVAEGMIVEYEQGKYKVK